MSHKIRIHSLRLLYNQLSQLVGWSGGWWELVRCKLIFASLVLIMATTPIIATNKKKHPKAAITKRDSVLQVRDPGYANIIYEIGGGDFIVSKGPLIFDVVEQMPEFPGGEKALFEFIFKHIDKSLINKDKNVSKIVYYRIAISKDGTIMQTEMLRGCGDEYNKDALRVIRLMPRWIPGVQNHEKVNVYYTLPINYNQKKKGKKQ